jgi:hypothetical protein
MVSIVEGNNWQTNHESSVSYAAMVKLIKQIVADIPGMDQPPETMPTEIKSLSAVLRDEKNGVIFLVKGIHQDDELHYNLRCVAAGGDSEFHVYVKQGLERKVRTMPVKSTPLKVKQGIAGKVAEVSLFEYKNSGISWRKHENSPLLLWPAVFVKNGYPGRFRGNSFSIGNSKVITTRGPNPNTETLIDP